MQRVPVDGDVNYVASLSDGRLVTVLNDPAPLVDLSRERPERWTAVRSSEDGGLTWTAPGRGFAYSAGPGFAMPVVTCADKHDRLHSFGLRFFGTGRDGLPWHSAVVHTASDDGGASWDKVKEVDFGHRYTGSLNGVLVKDNGRILLPLSYLAPERPSGQFVSMTVYSDDGGETWGRSNDCAVDGGGAFIESGAAEPVVVQLRSGFVWMVIRTTTGYFGESFSIDGAVWTPPQPTRIVSSNAPAGVLRLADGRIVLAWNNLYGEPMRENGISYARQRLHVAISADDAQTWSVPKVVAGVEPDDLPKAQTTYPYLCQAADGAIVLIYHRVHARPDRDWHHPIRELLRIDPDWLAE
ncbi:MAG: sialidase family protein [Thermomicrobiales bacterium]